MCVGGCASFYRDNRRCGREPSAPSTPSQRGVSSQPREGGLQEVGTDKTGAGCTHSERRAGLPQPLPRAPQRQDLPEGRFDVSAQAQKSS